MDGSREIIFPDGVREIVSISGRKETVHTDGVRKILEVNADEVVMFPDGQKVKLFFGQIKLTIISGNKNERIPTACSS